MKMCIGRIRVSVSFYDEEYVRLSREYMECMDLGEGEHVVCEDRDFVDENVLIIAIFRRTDYHRRRYIGVELVDERVCEGYDPFRGEMIYSIEKGVLDYLLRNDVLFDFKHKVYAEIVYGIIHAGNMKASAKRVVTKGYVNKYVNGILEVIEQSIVNTYKVVDHGS